MEAKKREKATERKQAEEQEQGKKVRFSEQEDQPGEMRAQSTDEQDVKMPGSWNGGCERRERMCRSLPKRRSEASDRVRRS